MIWWRFFWWIFWRVALSGALLGATFGTLLVPILGTVFGLIYGVILGVAVGVVSGLAEVLLIRTRFYPPTASKTFQKWSVAVVVVSAAITSPLMLIWLLANITPLIIITTLIATTATGYFAWKYPIHAQRLYAQKDLVEDDYLREHKSPIVW